MFKGFKHYWSQIHQKVHKTLQLSELHLLYPVCPTNIFLKLLNINPSLIEDLQQSWPHLIIILPIALEANLRHMCQSRVIVSLKALKVCHPITDLLLFLSSSFYIIPLSPVLLLFLFLPHPYHKVIGNNNVKSKGYNKG